MIQLATTHRKRPLVIRQVGAMLIGPGRTRVACDTCPRYSRQDEMSERGWCFECEREFARVLAGLKLRGIVS